MKEGDYSLLSSKHQSQHFRVLSSLKASAGKKGEWTDPPTAP